MEIALCPDCSEQLTDSLSCPGCGRPVDPPANKKLGPILSLLGSLFMGAGPFLPWLVYAHMTMSGVAETRKHALIFVGLAVFAAMFSISALTGKKFTGLRGNTTVGAVGCALATYFFLQIRPLVDGETGSPVWGSGMYFAIVGSALVLMGGVLTISKRTKGAEIPKL